MSWRQSLLSNGIEALISRITAAGPSAKRPPHIALLSAIALLLLLPGGCDRAPPSVNQIGSGAQAEAEGEAEPIEAGPRATLLIEDRGTPMPDVEFVDGDGQTVTLAEFEGKPVLVNLWATWCAPCVKELPTLDALAERMNGRMHVIAVSQDLKDRGATDAWFARARYTRLEPFHDQPNALGQHYGTGMLPTTVLYDARGREVWRVVGEMDWNGARAAVLMAEVLG